MGNLATYLQQQFQAHCPPGWQAYREAQLLSDELRQLMEYAPQVDILLAHEDGRRLWSFIDGLPPSVNKGGIVRLLIEVGKLNKHHIGKIKLNGGLATIETRHILCISRRVGRATPQS